MDLALTLFRDFVFGVVAVAVGLAFAAMAVQRRSLNPFGKAARLVRRLTDPYLKPIERRILKAGQNPQSAPWWMIGLSLIGGILAITAANWVIGEVVLIQNAIDGGGRTLVSVIVDQLFNLMIFVLIVRVIGSWMGVGEYTKWMRPFYLATEWFLAPLRRVLPTIGPLDVSPLVAWLALSFLRSTLLKMIGS